MGGPIQGLVSVPAAGDVLIWICGLANILDERTTLMGCLCRLLWLMNALLAVPSSGCHVQERSVLKVPESGVGPCATGGRVTI